MQNLYYGLPRIAILLLTTLLLVWIVPLLFTRTVKYFGPMIGRLADQTNEPSKLSAAGYSFYWTLFFTVALLILHLSRYQEHPELDGGTIAIIVLGFILSILRYRRWRRIRSNVGSAE